MHVNKTSYDAHVAKNEWNNDLKQKHENNIANQKRKFPFSYKYFENHDCEFFPCHKYSAEQGHNCMFCRCPLYQYASCPGIEDGSASWYDMNKNKLVPDKYKQHQAYKDCTNCRYNHDYDNADEMSRCP